jgi:outer membrane lipoprotein-sorting protein
MMEFTKMTKSPLPLFLSALVISLPVSVRAATLADVQNHLRAVTSMTADFAQTDRSGKTISGALSLKRPGKVRFQYQPNVPILIVGDGSALTFIDYSVKQVQRWPIGNTPLGVLLDPRKNLSGFARLIPSTNSRLILVEARDPKHPEYGTITMTFTQRGDAPAGLLLEGWTALDSQNNRTTIRLSNQRFNVPISDRTFFWRDPRPKGPRR